MIYFNKKISFSLLLFYYKNLDYEFNFNKILSLFFY